ncbi:hypothetical protein KCQ_06732 [Pectobacterium atrosepticum ICMP 1526]|nr:hypothetical protein KCQ_06732 [Pectobacterium atrosepticum ICMP 1526]
MFIFDFFMYELLLTMQVTSVQPLWKATEYNNNKPRFLLKGERIYWMAYLFF